MKLYRDGSVGTFTNYKKAISLAIAFGGFASVAVINFFWHEQKLGSNFELLEKIMILLTVFCLSSVIMFAIYRRPLLILKKGRFVFYTGLFNSDYVLIKEIKKFKIFADEDSISVDIYNKANLRVTFETRSIDNLEMHIKDFIEINLDLEVNCVNFTNRQKKQEL